MQKGYVGDAYIERIPVRSSDSLLTRGRDRYDIFCAACHGLLGDGDSAVSRNMPNVPARSLQEDRIRAYPPGRLFRVASEGYGLMNGYTAQLTVNDRWAVVAYVRALQASQHYDAASLSADERTKLGAP
ncbi:MAG: cytochrome c [Clostridia bacterium]|nr:cytochrome c [Deltaproteobacteria bacterium]